MYFGEQLLWRTLRTVHSNTFACMMMGLVVVVGRFGWVVVGLVLIERAVVLMIVGGIYSLVCRYCLCFRLLVGLGVGVGVGSMLFAFVVFARRLELGVVVVV